MLVSLDNRSLVGRGALRGGVIAVTEAALSVL
jgi:hypothetical protein